MRCIDKVLFKTSDFSTRKTKQDFIAYCIDLHRIESGCLNFSDKVGFSFAELLENCLDGHSFVSQWFLKSQVIVLAHESYEYDPDYAHIVPYIINRFNLTSTVVICISSYQENLLDHAKHILSAYLTENDEGLIVVFEQAVQPLCISAAVLLPESSSIYLYKYKIALAQ